MCSDSHSTDSHITNSNRTDNNGSNTNRSDSHNSDSNTNRIDISLQSAATRLHSKRGVGIDSGRQTLVLQRYCHVYRRGELEELWQSINIGSGAHSSSSNGGHDGGADKDGGNGNRDGSNDSDGSSMGDGKASAATVNANAVVEIEESFFDAGNWCTRVRKL